MKFITLLKSNWSLILVSFLILFLELLVIRLVSTEIRIFAYLSNLILLAIFVGLGLGMIIKKRFPITISSSLLFLLVVIVSASYVVRWPNLEFKLFSGITELLAPLSESYIWYQLTTFSKTGIVVGLFLTILLFVMIALLFLPLGQALGILLSKHKKPITAYSINIFASTLGLWAFQVFSLIRFTPYFGIILVLAALVFLVKNQTQKILVLIILLLSIAYIIPRGDSKEFENIVFWSPYQKLSLSPAKGGDFPIQPEGRFLEVNNVGYMSLLNLSKEYQATVEAKLKELYSDRSPIDVRFADQYYLPFRIKPDAQNVLLIGAGAGNDAAAAVRAKVDQIDAVEIDQTIIEIGRKYHYENPYRAPNVNVIIDDGRTVLQRTGKIYDLVVMGLADSHTLSSSLTNLRLDHYLYTKESFLRVKDVLSDDGIFFLTFEVQRPWIGSRIKRGLIDAFGHEPQIFEVRSKNVFGWGGVAFVVSKKPEVLEKILTQNHELKKFIDNNYRIYDSNINPLTDNWPYLYLDKPRIPLIHLLVAAILGGSLFLFRKRFLGQGSIDLPMFFWGAAFLLFEFQNISKTSLLFGLTWVTNLFTISAILILLLFANFTVYKKLISPRIAFVLLLLSLILQIAIPLQVLNSWNLIAKIILASLILNLPVYFGGIIFTNLFAQSKNKANAFGSNFLGAVLGGFAEMFSFLWGIHSLLFLVIIFYIAGFFLSDYLKFANFRFLPAPKFSEK